MKFAEKSTGYSYLSIVITIACLSVSIFSGCSDESTSPVIADNQLEYVTPEEVGYSSDLLKMPNNLLNRVVILQ